MNVDYSGQADAALPQPLAQTLPETVGEATWRRIRSDIIAGSLAPGKKLKLDTMRTSYGASVSTLREALNRLASEG
ncbi:MAG: GntR family transcriptional regulator, partial [Paracoccaceae bacterium]|nr:GntR family transcriptional regulator [Paracoccaceae bacterium]